MIIADELQASLNKALAHDPWYGPSTYDVIDRVSFEAAYEKPSGSVHNIAGILLHMLGWTQEVAKRMDGQIAGDPAGGDWPDPGPPDADKWERLKADFKLSNAALTNTIQNFPNDKWNEPISDYRFSDTGKGVSYKEMIEGLIQHHIYHSGQIALLNRINGG